MYYCGNPNVSYDSWYVRFFGGLAFHEDTRVPYAVFYRGIPKSEISCLKPGMATATILHYNMLGHISATNESVPDKSLLLTNNRIQPKRRGNTHRTWNDVASSVEM